MFPYVRLHFCSQVQGGFFSFGIFKSPSWAIQLCWISLRSSKIYLVMDAIKDSAKTVKKKRQDVGGIGTKLCTHQCLHFIWTGYIILGLFSIDSLSVAFSKNDVNLWSLRCMSHIFLAGENMLNVDVANEECASLENSPPQRKRRGVRTWSWNVVSGRFFFFLSPSRRLNGVTCQTLILWWSKRLKETYEQTWMSAEFFTSGWTPEELGCFFASFFSPNFSGSNIFEQILTLVVWTPSGKQQQQQRRRHNIFSYDTLCQGGTLREALLSFQSQGREPWENGLEDILGLMVSWHTHRIALISGIF